MPTTCGNGRSAAALQEILVPVAHVPVRRCRARDARQRKRRRKDVLAVAGARILRIEGIHEQRGMPLHGTGADGTERGAIAMSAGTVG